jgi:hypothetical protein
MVGKSGESERVEGTVLDSYQINRVAKVAKHVLVNEYTAYCTDVAVVEFDGSAEELLEALQGDSEESEELQLKVHCLWEEYDRDEGPDGCETKVRDYEKLAKKKLWRGWNDERGERKVSELPVHKLPSLAELKEELAKAD